MKGWRKGFQAVKIAQQDDLSDSVQTIAFAHHEAHEQNAFFAVHSLLRDNAEISEVRIQTSNSEKRAHMVIVIDVALAATAELWIDTTKTNVEINEITSINRWHKSTNPSLLTICHTPAGAQAGAANLLRYIGSVAVSGKSDVGGSGGSRGEFILARNTNYLIKVTSRANDNAVSIVLDWYEHEPTIEPE